MIIPGKSKFRRKHVVRKLINYKIIKKLMYNFCHFDVFNVALCYNYIVTALLSNLIKENQWMISMFMHIPLRCSYHLRYTANGYITEISGCEKSNDVYTKILFAVRVHIKATKLVDTCDNFLLYLLRIGTSLFSIF